MGKLTSVQEQSACVVYQLNDGTGAIEVKNWIDTDSDYVSLLTPPFTHPPMSASIHLAPALLFVHQSLKMDAA